jgi:hypothetical protein
MQQLHFNPSEPTCLEISLEHMVCGCGVVFAVPGIVLQAKRQRNEAWFCPNGHPCTDDGGTTAAAREDVSAVLRHIGDGTCPYCKKHYKRLDRHLAWKHQKEQLHAH